MSIKRYVTPWEGETEAHVPQSLSTQDGKLTKLQGDLGHTDLQEDLEFHSSSKPSMYPWTLP
jgi:hypothetical protein